MPTISSADEENELKIHDPLIGDTVNKQGVVGVSKFRQRIYQNPEQTSHFVGKELWRSH
jgi:hypothetical protein